MSVRDSRPLGRVQGHVLTAAVDPAQLLGGEHCPVIDPRRQARDEAVVVLCERRAVDVGHQVHVADGVVEDRLWCLEVRGDDQMAHLTLVGCGFRGGLGHRVPFLVAASGQSQSQSHLQMGLEDRSKAAIVSRLCQIAEGKKDRSVGAGPHWSGALADDVGARQGRPTTQF